MAEKKTSKSDRSLDVVSAADIARLAAQSPSIQDIAKQIAAISAPTSALKDISKNLAQYKEFAETHQTAADLAKALSGQEVFSNLTKNLAAAVPKINLNLPDISRTIQASLPRPITVPTLHSHRKDPQPETESRPKSEVDVSLNTPSSMLVTTPADLGTLVRTARERRNLSQQAFADLAGVGRRFISELENGKATLELGKVLKVARAAGISIFARDR